MNKINKTISDKNLNIYKLQVQNVETPVRRKRGFFSVCPEVDLRTQLSSRFVRIFEKF